MGIIHTLKLLTNHPLTKDQKIKTLFRFLKWQIASKFNPKPIIFQFTEKCKFIAKKGLTGITGNIYCGLHEFEDMGFLLHFLRESDLFVDIGANVGSYTILAGAHVQARTISIEPVPSTFERLKENIKLNNSESKATILNIALGSKKGSINFTRSLDTVNHVAIEGEEDTIIVEVNSLDNILTNESPALMKIDAEGFETEVLNGAENTLALQGLKAIIIELNGSGGRYGYDENLIHQKLLGFGFKPASYNPFTRQIIFIESFGSQNTIYIRDPQFVKERLISSEKVKILGKEF